MQKVARRRGFKMKFKRLNEDQSYLGKLSKLRGKYNSPTPRFRVISKFIDELQEVNVEEEIEFAKDYDTGKTDKEIRADAADATLQNILYLAKVIENL